MNFTVINEGFQCEHCEAQNTPHPEGSCRNHCSSCLYSKHLDFESPGDRASDCHGLMRPTGLSHSGKKGWRIIHVCDKCGYKILNITAPDDNSDLITELSRIPQDEQ